MSSIPVRERAASSPQVSGTGGVKQVKYL